MSSLWDSHRLGVEPMNGMTVIPSHDHDTDAGPVEYTVPPHHWDACRRTGRPFDTVTRTYGRELAWISANQPHRERLLLAPCGRT